MKRKLLVMFLIWGNTILGTILGACIYGMSHGFKPRFLWGLLLIAFSFSAATILMTLRILRESYKKEREGIGNPKSLLRNYVLIGLLVFVTVDGISFFDLFHDANRIFVGYDERTIDVNPVNFVNLTNIRPIDEEYFSACLEITKDLKAAGTKAVLLPITADFAPTEHNYAAIKELVKTGVVVFGAQPARVRQPFMGEWTASHPMNFQSDFSWGVISGEFFPFTIQYVPYEYWVLSSVSHVPDITLELIRKYAGYPDSLEIQHIGNRVVLGSYRIPVFRGGFTYATRMFKVPDNSLNVEYNKIKHSVRYSSKSHVQDSTQVSTSLLARACRNKMIILIPSYEGNYAYWNLLYYPNIITGIITGDMVLPLDNWNALFILFSVLLAAWVCYKLPPLPAALTLAACVIAIFIGGFIIVLHFNVCIETLYMIVSIGLCLTFMPISKFAHKKRNLEEHIALELEKKNILEAQKDKLEIEVVERTKELRMEKEETERLLYNILPVEIAKELQEKGTILPRRYEEISVLFSDFKGFTNTVSTMPANRLVEELNDIFRVFDDIIDKHGIEKIKTIGDSYLIAAGLPKESENHAIQCVKVALDMIQFIEKRNETSAIKWLMRVGIHSGTVIAGVVGKKKFTYDVWGDTVNIAQRMEASGVPGKVNISAHTYHLIKNEFNCEYRGKIDAKGKGEIDMYFVVGEKDNF